MNFKKVTLVTMVVISFLLLSVTVVFASSYDSIFDEVEAKFPNDIKKMKKNGASEGEIKSFMNEISDRLGDDLEDKNIEREVTDIVLSLYENDEYPDVFLAVKKGWNLSKEDLFATLLVGGTDAVYRMLPDSLQEIGDLVKDRLTEPDENTGGPSGGGPVSGGAPPAGPVVTTEKNENIIVESTKILEQLETDLPNILFNMDEDYAGLDIKAEDINKIFAANKNLEIKNSDGKVTFNLLPGTVETGDNNIRFKIKRLENKDAATLVGDQQDLASDIYELDIQIVNDKDETKASLQKPILVAIKHNASEEDAELLAIFRYNEKTKEWEYVGGKINNNNNTVEWQANHFSKYAVMKLDKKTFADIQNHWAQKDIEFLAARGILNWADENKFDSERPINRAEFAAMLVSLLDINTDNITTSKFTDVPVDAWYAKAVNGAYFAGLVGGVSADRYEPTREINRQEMMALITRTLKYKGIDTSVDPTLIDEKLAKYSDNVSVASWAKEVVVVALDNGIIAGRTLTTLAPLESTSRAEAAVIVKRLFNKIS